MQSREVSFVSLNARFSWFLLVFLFTLIWSPAARAAESAEGNAKAAAGKGPLYCADKAGQQQPCAFPKAFPKNVRFVVIPLKEEVSLGMAAVVDRVIKGLKDDDVLVLDVNTFGGRVDAAVKIRDALLEIDSKNIRTVAFVHPRAISAGALISLATDIIVMAPAGSMGAATPVGIDGDGEMQPVAEKVVSYMRSEMRATALAKGRDGELAEAMVDADIYIPSLTEKGKLLTLDTEGALAWSVASFTAANFDDLVSGLGYGADAKNSETKTDYTVETVEWNWAEKFAAWISQPSVSGLLMSLGTVALMVGIYTGGSALLLSIGAMLLGLFFFGHLVVDLIGLEEVILLLIGSALIVVELVVPGFGFPGIAGGLCLIAALALSFVSFESVPFEVQWQEGLLAQAINTALAAIIAAGVLGVLFLKRMPEASFGKRLSLDKAVTGKATDGVSDSLEKLIGKTAKVISELRPSGTIDVGGQRCDAVSEADFINKGATVVILARRGFSLVVRQSPASLDDPTQ